MTLGIAFSLLMDFLTFENPCETLILLFSTFQVFVLQSACHQTEPNVGRGLFQPGQCIQGEGPATRGARELPSRCAIKTGLHRWLHQSGRGPGGSRGHGAGSAGLRHRASVQSCEFTWSSLSLENNHQQLSIILVTEKKRKEEVTQEEDNRYP